MQYWPLLVTLLNGSGKDAEEEFSAWLLRQHGLESTSEASILPIVYGAATRLTARKYSAGRSGFISLPFIGLETGYLYSG